LKLTTKPLGSYLGDALPLLGDGLVGVLLLGGEGDVLLGLESKEEFRETSKDELTWLGVLLPRLGVLEFLF
jgi:hypothetical protein